MIGPLYGCLETQKAPTASAAGALSCKGGFLEKEESMFALMLMYQRLAFRIGAADEATLAALAFGVAGLAGLRLELAHHEAATGTVGVELAVGASGAEAGVAGTGFEQSQLLVFFDFVGRHGGAALVAGQLLRIGGIGTGCFEVAVLAALREGRARLGLRHDGGTNAQDAQQGSGKQLVHTREEG